MKEKVFFLHTDVILEDPNSINSFGKNRVGIAINTIEELDKIKEEPFIRGRNARTFIRQLEQLEIIENLEACFSTKGFELESKAIIHILFPPQEILKESTPGYPRKSSKKREEIVLKILQELEKKYDIELIAKSTSLRIKAAFAGFKTNNYKQEIIDEKSAYKGWRTITVSPSQFGKNLPDDLREENKKKPLYLNEFVILKSGQKAQNFKLFRYLGEGQFKTVSNPKFNWPIEARNLQQKMAFDILLDEDIKLITLVGPAGTGKTFTALVAALHETLVTKNFQKILITRPAIPLGADIGYLPGDIKEKLHTWMQPFYDNMEYMVNLTKKNSGKASGLGIFREMPTKKPAGKFKRKSWEDFSKEKKEILPGLDKLLDKKKINMEAITYMRGRSIAYQYIIIDEAQNLTSHEIKTLITRVGEKSKLILTGDPHQIDSSHLDFSNNGLIMTSQKFKGEKLFANVFLEKTERSELSKLAAELL